MFVSKYWLLIKTKKKYVFFLFNIKDKYLSS